MELASYVKNEKRYRIKSKYPSGPYTLDQLMLVDESGASYPIYEFKGQYRVSDRTDDGKRVNTTIPKAIINMILNK